MAEDQLTSALDRLHTVAGSLELPLTTSGRDAATRQLADIASQLSDYVLPRLADLDAPLLVVVGGSTGAGKSTLVNSIIGEAISPSGVLRPTTRTPVLVHHPVDAEWVDRAQILPDVPRLGASGEQVYALRAVASERVPRGMAILDAPDFDSIDVGNRALSEQLLAAADLWLFVTSAARYADQVPWDHLRRAAERSASVAVVLDRTSPEQLPTVRKDLAKLMNAQGLSESPLFGIEEAPLTGGLLPPEAVEDIVEWLHELASDSISRRLVIGSTLEGAIRQITTKSRDVLAAVEEQAVLASTLHDDVRVVHDQAVRDLMAQATDGTMLRGEVLARWQEYVGTGELFRALEVKVGRLRDRLFGRKPSGATTSDDVDQAVGTGLHLLILDHAERAAEDVHRAWADQPAGAAILDDHRGLDRASRDVRTRAERIAREWRASVFALVENEGESKRSKARAMSLGVNAVGVSLMVVVFAGTAGLTGAEVGIAGGTAALGQKVLEAAFGDQAVRDLAARAAEDLESRIGALFADEAARFTALLPDPDLLRASAHALGDAANGVDSERVVVDLTRSGLEEL